MLNCFCNCGCVESLRCPSSKSGVRGFQLLGLQHSNSNLSCGPMTNRSYSSLLEKGNYQKDIIKILDRKDKDQEGRRKRWENKEKDSKWFLHMKIFSSYYEIWRVFSFYY